MLMSSFVCKLDGACIDTYVGFHAAVVGGCACDLHVKGFTDNKATPTCTPMF